MATADYSLMSLLLFFLHAPVRFSEGSQSGSHSLYSDCAGLPLVKCREHIRALRSESEFLRPIAARKPFLCLCDNSNSYPPLLVLTFGILYNLAPSVAAIRKRSRDRRCISCIASGIDNRRCL